MSRYILSYGMKDFSLSSEGEDYGKADIHIHSSVSDGMATVPDIIEFVETRTDLDVIAITDHDRIEGSYEARELASKRGYRFQVVTGTEVTTQDGHLLALYIESPVPSFKPLEETIDAIHAQGGLCVVPHPMSWLTESILEPSLKRVVTSQRRGLHLDGIETINPTLAGRFWGCKVKRFQERYGLAETGGSDAHFLIAVGSGLTLFRGRSAADLRRSLEERTTRAGNGFQVGLRDVGLGQIVRQLAKSRAFPLRSILRGLSHG